MKKLVKILLVLLLGLTTFFAYGTIKTKAENTGNNEETEKPVETIPVLGECTYTSKEEVLKRVNEIRKEAYKEGLIGEYKEIKWSKDLEEIAMTRAAECESEGFISHARPNGTPWHTTPSENGVRTSSEVLAYHGMGITSLRAIEMWYSEKEDYIKAMKGESHGETGHYWALIYPGFTHIGIACIGITSAGEFTSATDLDETQIIKNNKQYPIDIVYNADNFNPKIKATNANKLFINEKAVLEYTLGSVLIDSSKLEWKSSNPKIVTVDKNGKITGKAAGKAEITTMIGNKTRTFNVTVMKSGWKEYPKGWSYMNADGKWSANKWQKIGGKWYHFNKSGYMQKGWLNDKGKWYYLKPSGAMATGWVGIPRFDWATYKEVKDWYYMNGSGVMQTGWRKISGKWYYFYSSGLMARNTWIGGYHLNNSGAWDY